MADEELEPEVDASGEVPRDGNLLVPVALWVLEDVLGLLSSTADQRGSATDTIEAIERAIAKVEHPAGSREAGRPGGVDLMAVEVYPLRLADAPSEVWYGVKANGTDLRAGWADPEAAKRAGERHIRELRERLERSRAKRGGETMETTERKTETTETEKTVEPVVVPPEDPKLPDDDDDDENDDDAKS